MLLSRPRLLGGFLGLVTAVVSLGSGTLAWGAQTVRYGRCANVGTPLYNLGDINIFRVAFVDHDAYVACLASVGRRVVFTRASVTDPPTFEIDGVKTSGTWLAWSSSVVGHGVIQHSMNIMTERRGPNVIAAFGSPITPTSGPPAPTDNDQDMYSLVITTSGDYAWIAHGAAAPPAQGEIEGLYVPYGRDSSVLVDSGAAGSITNLKAEGTSITWLHSGTRMRKVLP